MVKNAIIKLPEKVSFIAMTRKKLMISSHREAMFQLEFIHGKHVRAEQKSLLEFASTEDLEGIYQCKNRTEQIKEIIELVRAGKWEDFLNKFSQIEDAHYVLLAAYCYAKPTLTESEFVTAFEFLSIAKDVGMENCQIVRRTGENALQLGEENINLSKDEVANISDNEQVGIAIKRNAVMPEVAGEVDRFQFTAESNNMSCAYNFWTNDRSVEWMMCPSFSIMKHALKDKDNKQILKPVLAFTPRENYLSDIINGYSQIAILTPSTAAKFYVHGLSSEDKGASVFRYLHDSIYHTVMRMKKNIPADTKKIDFILKLDKLLSERPAISVSLVERGYSYPRLSMGATAQDLETKLMLDLLGDAIDGSMRDINELSNNSTEADIDNYINYILNEMVRRQEYKTPFAPSDKKAATFSASEFEHAKEKVKPLVRPIIEEIIGWKPTKTLENKNK